MAAMSIVYPIYTILVSMGNGLEIGVGAAIARSIGRGEHGDTNRSAVQGVTITVMVSVVLTPALFLTAEPVIT